MKLTKKQKTEAAGQLAVLFQQASHLYFTQYQGLKFVELAQLRSKLKPLSAKYRVIKNRLTGHALKEAGIVDPERDMLKGPIGLIAGQGDDPVAAAKVLAAFAKEFPLLKFKAGYVDRKWLKPEECVRLSSLGTRPEMLSALAGTLYGTIAQVGGALRAPLSQFALLVQALQEKKKGEAPTAAAA